MDGKRKVDSNNISNGKSAGLELMNMRSKEEESIKDDFQVF